MRILTLSYEFPPIGGGGSGVVKGLAREHVRMGHSVDVVTMGFRGLEAEETVEGIDVHRVGCDRRSESKCTPGEALRYTLRAQRVVRELLSRRTFDLVHAHFMLPDGFIALREAVPAGLPFIITAHGSDVPGYNQKAFFKIAHPLLSVIWKAVAKKSAMIVSPSRTLAELIGMVEQSARVTVIPNGVDPDKYRPGDKKPQILVATRLVERKGVQYLLEAVAGARSEWTTIVVGSGEYEAQIAELNERLGRPATLLGWVSNESERFRELLEESAVYVLPSDFENFPVSLLEAMAAGCAIITTRGHGCEEVVGDCAELVTPGSTDAEACVREIRAAAERLTSDPDYCAALGARARERLENEFSWSAIARRYEAFYEACLQPSSPVTARRPAS